MQDSVARQLTQIYENCAVCEQRNYSVQVQGRSNQDYLRFTMLKFYVYLSSSNGNITMSEIAYLNDALGYSMSADQIDRFNVSSKITKYSLKDSMITMMMPFLKMDLETLPIGGMSLAFIEFINQAGLDFMNVDGGKPDPFIMRDLGALVLARRNFRMDYITNWEAMVREQKRREELAKQTKAELSVQVEKLSRKEIIDSSLGNFGAIIVCSDMKQAVDFANELAPEHLEVCCENPMEYVGKLDNAGSVFLGNYSPEPLGDYFAGPNHVLPTSGTARFFSPLSVDAFIKKSSFIYYTEDALKADAEDVIRFAEAESLTAHANSIKVRFNLD